MPETIGVESRCATCCFYDPFTGICSNAVSDHYQGYMPYYAVCNEYTVIQEEYEE